jgi:ADP-heptose:LPS heptosyltransferase
MYCSPLIRPEQTSIPRPVREWIGARLSGPPRGQHRRQRACLYAVGRVGDFVLMLSALRLLIGHFGAKSTVLVVSRSALPLANLEFPGVACLTLPPEGPGVVRDIIPAWWRERGKFAHDEFDQRICLRHQRGLFYEVTFSWIRAEKDVRIYPADYPTTASPDVSTELLAHRVLVERVLGRSVTTEEILPRFERLPTGNDGRLLIYPLSQDPVRCLSVAQVTDVLRLWRQRSAAPAVFGGSPGDASRLAPYVAAAQAAGIAHISLETPAGVVALIGHIAGAGAVLASESGATHIATALDKPAVIMTGGGLQGLCYPWRRSARQHSVQHPLPCFACDWHCNQPEMYCLTRLPVARAAGLLPALENAR